MRASCVVAILGTLASASACGRLRYQPLRDAAATGLDASVARDAPSLDTAVDAPGADARRPLVVLFATGVDDTGAILADDARDPHWTVTTTPPGGVEEAPEAAYALPPQNFCSSCGGIYYFHPRPHEIDDSRPLQDVMNVADAEYRYRTTFDVPAEALPTVSIDFLVGFDDRSLHADGRWVDGEVVAIVNGAEVTAPCVNGDGGAYDTMCRVALPASALVAGSNTLEFRIFQAIGPYGFRLRDVRASY